MSKIYNWYACDGEAGGYLCCKPLGHSGKCLVKFSNTSAVMEFEYKDDGDKFQTPITITEKEILKFNINKNYILQNQWTEKDIKEANERLFNQAIQVCDTLTSKGRAKIESKGVKIEIGKNKQFTFIVG